VKELAEPRQHGLFVIIAKKRKVARRAHRRLPAGRQGILPLGKRTAGPYRRLSWGWADLQWVEGKESGGGAYKFFILAKESRKKTEEPSRPK